MIIRRASLGGLLFISGILVAADAPLEFSGVMTAEGKTRVALTDKSTKITTWVEPGVDFKGYSVARYDAKEEAVFLKRGRDEIRLPLIAARTTAAVANTQPPLTPAESAANANTQAVRSNLRQLATIARQQMQERGVSSVSFADLVGPGKPIQELVAVAGENYSTLSFAPNVTAVSVTTGDGRIVTLDIPPPSSTAPSMSPPAVSSTTTVIAGAAPSTMATPGSTPPAPSLAAATNAAMGPANNVAAATPAPAPLPTTVANPDATAGNPSAPPAQNADSAAALAPTGRQPASPSYTIQGGDTWQKVSERTGVPLQQLRELNSSILDGSSLPAGQTIRIR